MTINPLVGALTFGTVTVSHHFRITKPLILASTSHLESLDDRQGDPLSPSLQVGTVEDDEIRCCQCFECFRIRTPGRRIRSFWHQWNQLHLVGRNLGDDPRQWRDGGDNPGNRCRRKIRILLDKRHTLGRTASDEEDSQQYKNPA